jgi:hypothetical protein
MLEDQLKLRYEDGQNAWIFNEIEYFVELGNSKDSIILFYVGEDEIDPNALIKDMIDRCEANGVVCKALNYLYQPGKIVKRLRDFKDKGKEINQYATAIIAAFSMSATIAGVASTAISPEPINSAVLPSLTTITLWCFNPFSNIFSSD